MNLEAAQRASSSRSLVVDSVDRTRTAVQVPGAAAPIVPSGSGEPTTIKPKATG